MKKAIILFNLGGPDKLQNVEPFLFNLLGVANGAEGNFEEAIISYKEALSLNSQYFEVYNNIGVAYTDWGKPDLALEYLEKALDINPKYAEAFNNIGNAKKKLSDIDSAIESYEKAIEVSPGYADAWYNKAELLKHNGQDAEAETCFTKVKELEKE